jgi:hypothetical protein
MSLTRWLQFRFRSAAAPNRRRAALLLEILEDRMVPSAFAGASNAPAALPTTAPRIAVWINPVGGDWDNRNNWSGNFVPKATDDAVIFVPGVVVTHKSSRASSLHALYCTATLDVSAGSLSIGAKSSISVLDLSGGALLGTGDVTVDQRFTWTGGTLGGGGRVTAGQVILGGGAKTLDGRTLVNQGDGGWYGGDLQAAAGGQLFNAAGASFTVQTTASFAAEFVNAGTLVFAANLGTANLTNILDNSGKVDLQGGWLNVGQYTQTDGGVLTVALAGAGAGQFDQLVVTGTASVAGTLEVVYVNGFAPRPGDNFPILSFGALTGGFTTLTGLKSSNGVALTAVYNPNGLVLTALSSTPSSGGGNSTGSGGNTGTSSGGGGIFTGGGGNSGGNFAGGGIIGQDGSGPGNPPQVIANKSDAILPLSHAQPSSESSTPTYQNVLSSVFEATVEVYRAASSGGDKISGEETAPERATESSKGRAGGADIAGAASGEFLGMTDDELLAKLFTSGNVLEGFSDENLLPALDLASALLTGRRPRPDILPQKGQQASPLTTLLADDGDPTPGAAVPGLETPLLELLIDPTGPSFRRLPAAPARADRPPVHAAPEKTAAVPSLEWRPFLLAGVLPLWWGVRRATARKESDDHATPRT